MTLFDLTTKALDFRKNILEKKLHLAPKIYWYPYDTLAVISQLADTLTDSNREIFELIKDKPIADIGAADGDLAFFMESVGVESDIIDFSRTNFNQLNGARALKKVLPSSVNIYDLDIDSPFTLPRNDYGLIFFLGILYHLKDPFHALETLTRHADYCIINTKITKFTSDRQVNISNFPVAYLLDAGECNDDKTNYWIFTEKCLKLLFDRTGWQVLDFKTFGNTIDSDPASFPKGDERALCLLKKRRVI